MKTVYVITRHILNAPEENKEEIFRVYELWSNAEEFLENNCIKILDPLRFYYYVGKDRDGTKYIYDAVAVDYVGGII